MKIKKENIMSKINGITTNITNETKTLIIDAKEKITDKFENIDSKKIITQEDIVKTLNKLYDNVLNGLGKASPSVEVFANDYLKKEDNASLAAKKMLNNQILKCTTSGFITGFGGFITLPIAIPANISSVLYVQMRMIACTAYMAGYDLKSDQVQTLVYACLAGVSVTEVVKKTGVKIGVKMATSVVKKIPGKTLTKINQKVGFRFITKFGEKGIINLGKLVPGVGAVISSGLDYAETKIIANRAFDWFFKGEFLKEELDV